MELKVVDFNEQLELFKLIGEELKEKAECYVIGGSAMMFYNAKFETKDIDLVFTDKTSLEKVKNVLKNLNFEEKKSLVKIFKRYEESENEKDKPVMMVREAIRFDLFLNKIITFKMSESILNRVRESHEFGKFIVKVVSPEDIILLKSATEREKDRPDAFNLIDKFNIKWDIIIEECVNQTKIESYLFPVYLFDFLYELKEDLKADIPKDVINKIRKISEDLLEEYLKKRRKKKS